MTFIIIVWGARGRWFESSHPDRMESIDNLMIVDAFCFISLLLESCGLIGGLIDGIKLNQPKSQPPFIKDLQQITPIHF